MASQFTWGVRHYYNDGLCWWDAYDETRKQAREGLAAQHCRILNRRCHLIRKVEGKWVKYNG